MSLPPQDVLYLTIAGDAVHVIGFHRRNVCVFGVFVLEA